VGEGEGVATSSVHPAHGNRGEDSVWENRGGARAERERSRGWEEAQSWRERAQERTRNHGERERRDLKKTNTAAEAD